MERTHGREADQETVAHWQALARHTPLAIVCDVDGTLLPFSPSPTHSELPPRLVSLLNALAHEPGVQLVIVSGRLRAQLEHLMQPVPGAWLVISNRLPPIQKDTPTTWAESFLQALLATTPPIAPPPDK